MISSFLPCQFTCTTISFRCTKAASSRLQISIFRSVLMAMRTMRLIHTNMSAFAHGIPSIVSRSSRKKMLWIHTPSIIASMANKKPAWYKAMRYFIRYSMGLLVFIVYMKASISIYIPTPRPHPTRGGLFYFGPKMLNYSLL